MRARVCVCIFKCIPLSISYLFTSIYYIVDTEQRCECLNEDTA